MLSRWQPFGDVRAEMSRLHDEMNRLFDRWSGRQNGGGRMAAGSMYPPLNVWEDEDHLYVEAELPGFDLSDLEIYVTGENQLNIKGERKEPELKGGTWHRQERGHGGFSRMIGLPGNVNADKVSAEFKHGVLTVTLPKSEEVKPRRIEVKSD